MAKLVKIGDFRNHLSSYLRKVRQGAEIVISDRKNPVGRLIPYGAKGKEEVFELIDPENGYKGLTAIPVPKLKKRIHAVNDLLTERRKR